MSRTKFAAKILRPLAPRSILDIGCREASLAGQLPTADYYGADLSPDENGLVKYVGDVMEINFDRTFDAVVACDILEHLDRPSELFDRIVGVSDRLILISLPNTYDLKSRVQFLRGGLGGKYVFLEESPNDRHRWLMNRRQIIDFYEAKARKHGLGLQLFDLTYGASLKRTFPALTGRTLARILPRSLTSETIFGLFTKSTESPARRR